MARRSSKRNYSADHVPLDVDRLTQGWSRPETSADGREWSVRAVGGGEKTFRCPGCDQEIAPGTPHLVVVPTDHLFGADAALGDRRHWHTSCWRSGRRPTRRR